MQILLGVASRGAPELLRALDPLVSLSGQELLLVHVMQNGERVEMDLARAALDGAVEVALALGALPETLVEEGDPGRVLCRLIEERDCELAAVAASAGRHPEGPGPKSVGHTARFVLDHSPRPVLLIRGSPPADSSRSENLPPG